MRASVLASATVLFATATLHAQSFTAGPCPDSEQHHWEGKAHACELRRVTLPLSRGGASVSGDNGGIELIGEDRQDVLLEAAVSTQAPTQAAADALVHQITISTDGGISARGPSVFASQPSWYVNFTLHVPHHSDAELSTHNGGITLRHVEGKLAAETHNGGITATDLGGDVHLLTVNGGLEVALAGSRWVGAALSARTTNGGISVKAPSGYSAHLITQTEHGGTSIDFPVTMRGALGKRVDTSLGQGGAIIEFVTVNGGVSISKS